MRQLDPKAVWLFFMNSILVWFITFSFVALFLLYISMEGINIPNSWWFGLLKAFLYVVPPALVVDWIWIKLVYKFYRYELREDGFRKELGVIRKKYVTIPYDRIQNVDINRGILARMLGLSDLRIQTAGSSSAGLGAEGKLPGLSQETAEDLRDELIKRAKEVRI